ncbi:hypothetical protein BFL28_07215 [Sphingomonas turrisvirgatae]|uniref:Uncharacterized protein n=1 Tax=Sphingomonas turrisvirgatae TaxID=1888892 RepID=A0A1E3LRC5_9SPHN|nr:hypothetical protein BFL28_07215 [Sphingomonas turrisvirgatae]
MAGKKTLVHPVLFSKHFKVDPKKLDAAKLLDPVLNSDTKLFIDPLLIHKSQNSHIKRDGRKLIKQSFDNVIGLVDISKAEGDAAWKGAFKALNLDERPETGLGFGGAGTSGSSRPPKLRNAILRTAKEIITLGEKNPDMIPLMGLFEEGVGPDTLSDMTTGFLMPVLCEITDEFCRSNNIATRDFGPQYGNRALPENPYYPSQPIVLVPRDLLRDLPLAADWSDVSRVVMEVHEIRDAVNQMFGNFAQASVTEKKKAVRKISLKSVRILRLILKAVAAASESYDEKADLDGYYQFRRILYQDPQVFAGMLTPPATMDAASLRATVLGIIDQFKKLVEDNNMWELLWNGTAHRHERASQLLFFAVATVMCAVNNVDISPETNSGGGPVDFKFSTGFRGRLVVEMKLSTGKVEHGYKTQLEAYKKAAATSAGVFVIMNIGGMGLKLKKIERLRDSALAAGEVASDIIVIDARRKASASKR